ncbi:MAG TPA: redoxin domain-containing protein [Terriglobia bacterium]|nr:redoxin domain-containing protein [Terriglobia bacterium]
MTKRIQVVSGAVLAVAVAIGFYFFNARWLSPAPRQVKAAVNYPIAPDFSVTDINGARLALADYKGKVVLLDFWATWCGPCRIEIPWFVQLQQKYRDQGFEVVGVAMEDTPEAVNEFYQQFHLNYPVALGDSQVAARYGGIGGLPTSFLIGRDGRVYSEHTGTTSSEVFEGEIQQLLSGKPGVELASFSPVGDPQEIDIGTPEEANPDVPGVDISKLSPAELADFKKQLDQTKCSCGCKFTVLQCRKVDTACSTSRQMAREALKQFQASKGKDVKPAT